MKKKLVVSAFMFVAILLVNYSVSLGMASRSNLETRAPPPAPAMWIEPVAVDFDTTTAHVGTKFNVTVWASAVSDVFTWQCKVMFDPTQLTAVRAAYTGGSGSQWFAGHTTVPVSFIIDNSTVWGGETLLGVDVVHASSGSLCWIEFQIMTAPPPDLTSLIDTNSPDSFLLDPDLNEVTGLTRGHATYTFTEGPPPPTSLSASINPSSASVLVGQSLLFTSSVSGGTLPYGFQWFLNSAAVPGATSNTWTFSSMTSGDFTVHLNVTDSLGATAKSNIALVTVTNLVTPSVIEGTLYPGEIELDTITVNLPSSTPKGDVVFVFDTTGSMRWIISDMQAKAIDIMNGIRAVIPDTAFGVGSFCDYPNFYDSYGYMNTYGGGSDYAFKMDIDITLDTTAVSTAINNIVYGGGSDGPEDYTRAVWEALHYDWRTGAKRIVVLVGDAPPHSAPSGLNLTKPWNPSELLFSEASGGDPGPDEIMFTADDLDYGPVVQQVRDNYLTFVCVDCQSDTGPGYPDDAHNNFNYLANMTDGTVFPYTSGTIADDIIVRIQEIAARPIGTLTLEPDPTYASWVSSLPTSYYNVSWGTGVSFDTRIAIPMETPPGDYTFGINVVGDGVTLGTVNVIKHVLMRASARQLKLDAITELLAAEENTTNKQTTKRIDKAIEKIWESLDPTLWIDEVHLHPKHGKKVFDEEKNAVDQLLEILKDAEECGAVKSAIEEVIGKLVRADKMLADTAIGDAKALGSTDSRVIHEIKEADRKFSEALQELTRGKYNPALAKLREAWMHAEHALKKAFGDVTCDGKVDVKDIALVAKAFGSSKNKPNWNVMADANGDDKVDIRDIGLVCANVGNVYN